MFKMLIADDRRDITDYIAQIGHWDEVGVEVVGCAYDGGQAFEMVKQMKPDILLTDIKMPVMDGLELTRLTKEIFKDIVVVLLSSYDEFSYAQKAISFGAEEYILKPAKIEDIEKVISKYCEKIKNKNKKYYENEIILQKLKESMPLLKNEYLKLLCTNQINEKEDINHRLKYLGIDLDSQDFFVIIFTIDDISDYNNMENDLLLFSMVNIIEETIADYAKAVVFKFDRSNIVCIINAIECTAFIYEFAQLSQNRLQEFLGLSVSIGIGRNCKNYHEIYISYHEAMLAIQERFILGKGSIINVNNVEMYKQVHFVFPYEKEKNFIEYLSIGLKDIAIKEYIEIVQLVQSENKGKSDIIKNYLINLVPMISRKLLEKDIYFSDILGNEYGFINKMESMTSLKGINNIFIEIITGICDYIYDSKKQNSEKMVYKIIENIKRNYDDSEISLSKFSHQYFISTSNLSIMLKQALGENFTDFLTRLRMERAKTLLSSPNIKVYEVAEKVGYIDRRYFSELFKKYTGYKPTEYTQIYAKVSSEVEYEQHRGT